MKSKSFVLTALNVLALLPASAFAKANLATYEIAILGDSITAGYGVAKTEAFPHKLEQNLHTLGKKQVRVHAAGISGSTTASGVERLQWLMKKPWQLLIIELGANDGLRGQEILGIKKNLKAMVQTAKKQKDLQIKLLEMELPANYGKEYREKFRQVFAEVAKEEKIGLIESFFYRRLQAEPKIKKEALFLADGLHPNSLGHSLIADELAKVLLPSLP